MDATYGFEGPHADSDVDATESSTVALSDAARGLMQEMLERESFVFKHQQDFYRFAAVWGLLHRSEDMEEKWGGKTNLVNTANLDPSGFMKMTFKIILDSDHGNIYKTIERFAERGVRQIYRECDNGARMQDLLVALQTKEGD